MVRGIDFKYVRRSKNKGKKDKFYFVKYRGTPQQQKPVPMPDDIESPEFARLHRELMGEREYQDFTFKTLIANFKTSEEFLGLGQGTIKFYRTYLKRIAHYWNDFLVADLKPKNVLLLRDTMAKEYGKSSANNFLTTLANLISWGVPREFANFNVCDDIKPFKKGEGWAPWTDEAIEFWRKNARPELVLAMEYALYLGQRQADLLELLKSDKQGAGFVLKQNKGKKNMWVPIHSRLSTIIDEQPKTSLWCLNSSTGQPWTINSFKSAMDKEKNKPKMAWFKEQGFVFHGLRKNAVVNLLEAGCTPDEVKAITGHETTAMVEFYGKGVNQIIQAKNAIIKLENHIK